MKSLVLTMSLVLTNQLWASPNCKAIKGWKANSACTSLATNLDRMAAQSVKTYVEDLINFFDRDRAKPTSQAILPIVEKYAQDANLIGEMSIKFRNSVNREYYSLRSTLQTGGHWNECPDSLWRTCQVIALSEVENHNRSMSEKVPNTFRVDTQDQINLLEAFAVGFPGAKIGEIDVVVLSQKLAEIGEAATTIKQARKANEEYFKTTVEPAVKQFLDEIIPDAEPTPIVTP